MVRGVDFVICARSANSSGITSPGARAVDLDGLQTFDGLDDVLALIDADDDVVDDISRMLTAGCSSPCEPGGEDADTQEAVLDVLRAISSRYPSASVALMARIDDDAILVASGGAGCFLMGEGGELGVAVKQDGGETFGVERLPLVSTGFLVLAGSGVGDSVDAADIREAVHGSVSVEHAAAWLASLGYARSGRESSALVAGIKSGRSDSRRTRALNESPSRGAGLPALSGRATAGLIVIVAVVAALTVGSVVLMASPAIAPTAPTHLRATPLPPGGVSLSWRGAREAAAYVVTVGGNSYRTRASSLVLLGVLPGGRTYSWTVDAVYGDTARASSTAASLHVPPALSTVTPLALRPVGTVHPTGVGGTSPILFCWKFTGRASSYSLLVGGGLRRYNHWSLSGTMLSHPNSGVSCYSQALQVRTSYSWRVAANSPGFLRAWTPWAHFRIT